MNTAISPASLPGAPLPAAGPSRPRSADGETPGRLFSEALDRSRQAVSPEAQTDSTPARPRGKQASRVHDDSAGADAAINGALAALMPVTAASPRPAAAEPEMANAAGPLGAAHDRSATPAGALSPRMAWRDAALTPEQTAALRGRDADPSPGARPEQSQMRAGQAQRNGLLSGAGGPAATAAALATAPLAAAGAGIESSAEASESPAPSAAGRERKIVIAAESRLAPSASAVATPALQRSAEAAGAEDTGAGAASIAHELDPQDDLMKKDLASAQPLTGPIAAPAAPGTPAAGEPAVRVAPAVGSSDWGLELAHQLVRLPAGQREVELNLNPAHLGPLKVTLSVHDNQAQIMFASDHAAVRHAIEVALPQLRTSFADNGISLGQASVGSGSGEPRSQQGTFAQQAPEARPPADAPASGSASPGQHQAATMTASRPQGSAVDTFA